MTRRPVSILGTLLMCLWALPVSGQESAPPGQPATDPPAHISVVDGTAVLERDGRSDAELLSMPLLSGDRVRTQAGRVEVLFADGSALHLDENTVVDFQSDEVVRLLDGRVRLSVVGTGARDRVSHRRAVGLGADQQPGRVSRVASCAETKSSWRSCAAARSSSTNRAAATCRPASAPTHARRPRRRPPTSSIRRRGIRSTAGPNRAAISGSACPRSTCPKTCGGMRRRSTPTARGVMSRPTATCGTRASRSAGVRTITAAGSSLRPYGWTWIANDPWGWPTHHYGRWGISAGSWFWIPGRSWAPAWVSWGYAPATSAGVRSAGTTGRFSASR